MRIYHYTDYREFIQAEIRAKPNDGRGELQRIAKAIHIHPSTLSQVFQKHRHITSEQTLGIADYFSLTDEEANYLLLLVQFERAGTERLRLLLHKQIQDIRAEFDQLSKRLPVKRTLSFEEKAVFYSNWYYSACRILTSIPEFQTIDRISERLKLARSKTMNVVRFLLANGLCVEEDGLLKVGPESTHIEAASPLVNSHHSNWRVKAMEKHPKLSLTRELAYTSPMSVSKKDAIKIRELLMNSIQSACTIVDSTDPEELYCLNVDWFSVG